MQLSLFLYNLTVFFIMPLQPVCALPALRCSQHDEGQCCGCLPVKDKEICLFAGFKSFLPYAACYRVCALSVEATRATSIVMFCSSRPRPNMNGTDSTEAGSGVASLLQVRQEHPSRSSPCPWRKVFKL